MPVYHLNIHDGIDAVDEEGIELLDLAAATNEAVLGARSLIADAATQGEINLAEYIEITDERGALLHRLYFRDAVKIVGYEP